LFVGHGAVFLFTIILLNQCHGDVCQKYITHNSTTHAATHTGSCNHLAVKDTQDMIHFTDEHSKTTKPL